MNSYIKSPLNYTGGKFRLLPQFMPLFPDDITEFWDLFCGGANVGINVTAEKTIYNDFNSKLIGVLRIIKKYDYDELSKRIDEIIKDYSLSNTIEHSYSFYGCDSGAGLGDYNKERYMHLRNDFNKLKRKDDKYYLMLFTLIIFAFNNQIRFNSKNEFNLPIGKRDFNRNIRANLKSFSEALHNQNATLLSTDFRKIETDTIDAKGLVYCDPPYLITTASYNEMGGWTAADEKDLLSFLDELNSANKKFALSNVITHKGRINELLAAWAEKYNIHFLDYNYSNSSYHGKNTKEKTQEVLITNY